MMTRKKRKTILIVFILILIITIAGIIGFLYLNTDMFKSNKTLFMKYIGKNVENMKFSLSDIGETQLDEILKNSQYTENTTIKVNNTENIGTTSETTENVINQLEIQIDGQTDKNNKYVYKDIKLKKQDEDIFRVEYIENETEQGIKFSDMFKQYILKEKTSEELPKIYSQLIFSEEEKQILQEKYLKNIIEEIPNEKFSKQSDATINIDEKNVFANVYTLTLTKEELNSVYLKLLQSIKEDEIILQKITDIEGQINQYSEQELSVKEQFTMYIDNIIEKINATNIGQDATKIIVYENQKELVRTMIQTPDYEINLDFLKTGDEKFTQFNIKQNEKENTIQLRSQAGLFSLDLKFQENSENKNIAYTRKNKVQNDDISRNYTLKYEDNQNRVEANISQEFTTENELEQQKIENSINLDELNEEQKQKIMDQVTNALSNKINIISTQIDFNEILQVLKNVGIIQDTPIMENIGITETEKNRYNSQFEMLKGEELDGGSILNILEAIKGNINGFKVENNKKLKLEIDRNNSNEEVVQKLNDFYAENKKKRYNVDVEYDENGLINYMIIEIVPE